MPFPLSLAQLTQIINSTILQTAPLLPDKVATGLTTDSRKVSVGEIFVALRGERFDGHDFAQLALEKGAIALIVERPVAVSGEVPQFQVPDTLQAYQQIARWWRDRLSIPVISITGSVGKTTTKELIAAVLSTQGKVLKTQANYNNEIGVPKTLLELDSAHDYAVIEMAMRAKGEIALLTQIARPTIGVITNVGTAHIGRLGSEEAIAQAKCELLAQMPAESVAILNHDNQRLLETAAGVWQGKTVTYGLTGGDIRGELIDSQTLRVEEMILPLPLPGRHNALNYLAALAVARVLGVDWSPLQQGLAVQLPQGRSQRHQLANDILILDETYNAGFESMVAALHLLKETPGKRHLAVLGTMKELGDRSAQLHRQVGETVKQLNLDYLLVLADDPEAEALAAGALDNEGKQAKAIVTECWPTQAALGQRLKELVQPGDRLLFKASNSVGLQQVVEEFVNS